MRILILAFMLLAAIKSNAQKVDTLANKGYLQSYTVSQRPYYEMARPAEDLSKLYGNYPDGVKPWLIQNAKPSFRIDSAYLQLIIAELERHGYTLVKLPKKN